MSVTRKTDIVVTTIFEPAWLPGYLDNLRANGREQDVTFRIICDRKTPSSVYGAADEARRAGFRVDCPALDEQESYLRALGLAPEFIPWNTDNRRNIGFLRAWQEGCDVLISIDDDNYCPPSCDFVGEHSIVGGTLAQLGRVEWAGEKAWYNICERLETSVTVPVYARGYPYAARAAPPCSPTPVPDHAMRTRIAVNAGLWTDDPDVDALTRLSLRPRVRAARWDTVILGPKTWSPINTQNTALIREAMPAYYYVRMGFPLQGMRIDRFGDILSGYFLQACAKRLGDAVSFGGPVAEHRRSTHNLFRDLYFELAGIVLLEELLPWLQEVRLDGGSYADAYASLADALQQAAPQFRGFVWDEGGRDFLVDTARCMQVWLDTVRRLS